MSFAYRYPSVSVDLHPPKAPLRPLPITRNRNSEATRKVMEPQEVTSPLLQALGEMLDADGERATDGMAARATCPHCGNRALDKTGHPIGRTGKPKCQEPPECW